MTRHSDSNYIISQASEALFQRIWETLQEDLAADQAFPANIFWLNGAPGAGKGTQSACILKHCQIDTAPVVISDLLQSESAKTLKDAGKLVDDFEVTSLLFKQLLNNGGTRALVDGYPRTQIQAELAYLLLQKLEQTSATPPSFHIIVLHVDETTSIERQLDRGQKAKAENSTEIRKTDNDPKASCKRYSLFIESTYDCIKKLGDHLPYYEIDASGSIDSVQASIHTTLPSS